MVTKNVIFLILTELIGTAASEPAEIQRRQEQGESQRCQAGGIETQDPAPKAEERRDPSSSSLQAGTQIAVQEQDDGACRGQEEVARPGEGGGSQEGEEEGEEKAAFSGVWAEAEGASRTPRETTWRRGGQMNSFPMPTVSQGQRG